MHSEHGATGETMVEISNQIMDATFKNDQNYQFGMLYDWSMNPLKEVEFKFQKIKTRTAIGQEVEYYVQFKSGFNPEFEYKDLYYKKDGRERYGFYIDVLDRTKNIKEKWLIVSKDQRVAFDRYNVYRCNWCFEWIYEDEYHKAIGCVRDGVDNTFSDSKIIDKLGGSLIDGELKIVLPVTPTTRTILVGSKFIISDNTLFPQTYQVTKIKDSSPLGVMQCELKQRQFNEHTDYYGIINDERNIEFKFDLPIDDLPDLFGGPYHAICDCIKTRGLPPLNIQEKIEYNLFCNTNQLFIDGSPVTIELVTTNPFDTSPPEWCYQIDGEPYDLSILQHYFDIEEANDHLTVSCTSKDMNKYMLSVYVEDKEHNQSNLIDLEVKK